MGRGKLPMGLILNEKARKLAMEKRKMNLKKKAHELSTLCDVPVCVIMYDGLNSEPPLLYPENRDEAQSIINRYLSIPKDENQSKRKLNLEDMVEGGPVNKRRRIGDSASPDLMSGLSRDKLFEMAAILDRKLQFVQSRIAGFENNANLGQICGGFDPDFEFMASVDQEQGLWFANCCDQQQQEQQQSLAAADENAMLFSGSQFCSADQQQQLSLMASTSTSSSGLEAVLGFHGNGINFY